MNTGYWQRSSSLQSLREIATRAAKRMEDESCARGKVKVQSVLTEDNYRSAIIAASKGEYRVIMGNVVDTYCNDVRSYLYANPIPGISYWPVGRTDCTIEYKWE